MKIKSLLLGAVAGGAIAGAVVSHIMQGKIVEKEKRITKFKDYYNLYNRWIKMKSEKKELKEYFQKHNYRSIVIYGVGEIGKRLYEELKESGIDVCYAIDSQDTCSYTELKIVTKDDVLETADVMVVTPLFDYEGIRSEMSQKVDFPIISIQEIVDELELN